MFDDVCLLLAIIIDAADGLGDGDIDFGFNIDTRPTFQFIGSGPGSQFRFITIYVNDDNILEAQEIGLLTIAPSTSFDGFLPKFRSVRIIINDSNSEWIILSCMHLSIMLVRTHNCGDSTLF